MLPAAADRASHRRSRWYVAILAALCGSGMLLLSLLWIGFEVWNASSINLVMEYQVPDEYPDELATSGKGGRDPHVKHPREEYAYWFGVGFNDCRRRFAWPRFPTPDPAPLNPYDDQEAPGLKQYGGYERRADEDGFRACRLQLKHLSDLYGMPRVSRAVRWKYGSFDKIIGFYVWQNAAPLRLTCGVIAGAACILAICKLINRWLRVSL